MMALLIVVAFLSGLFAPAPPGIAINPETKECGYYWAGDEYTHTYLPAPWKTYHVGAIQTETGTYQWDGNELSVESFCNQIGYAYIPGDVGSERGKLERSVNPYMFAAVCNFAPLIIVLAVVFLALFLFVRWVKKRSNNAPAA